MRTRESPVKIGVIGIGGIAEVAHLPGYRAAGAEVHALCARRPETAAAIAGEYSVRHVTHDYRELLALEEIEAVSVCVPTHLHAEVTLAALRAGKHVLCEKPPALGAADARAMRAAAAEQDRLLMYALSARFRAPALKLRRLAEEGELGTVYGARAGWLRRRGNPAGWFTDRARSGGGALIDLGIHGLDLAWWLMGRPQPRAASGHVYREFGNYQSDDAATPDPVMQRHLVRQEKTVFDVEDSAFAMISFDNGAHLLLEASWALNCARERRYVTCYGTRAGAELTEEGIRLYGELAGALADTRPQVPEHDAYQAQMRHFVAAIRGEEEPLATGDDGVALMAMVDAIYESARQGRQVPIDPEDTNG